MPYEIRVTYGTIPDQVYARPDTYAAAERLLKAAKERGYDDAKIVPVEEVRQAKGPRRRGPGGEAGPHRRAS